MNNRTKERKFVADNALLFLHLQVYDFLIHKNTLCNAAKGITLLEGSFTVVAIGAIVYAGP